jgi:hypothetical protein
MTGSRALENIESKNTGRGAPEQAVFSARTWTSQGRSKRPRAFEQRVALESI